MTNSKFYYISHGALSQHLSNLKIEQTSILDLIIDKRTPLTIEDNIAFIDIHGPLADNAPPIHEMVGGTNYSTIKTEIDTAIQANVKGIVFTTDSPGGAVHGCQELSDTIASLPCPTVSFCSGLNCSAAYMLTVATDAIIARPTSQVGNVGVIQTATRSESEHEIITNEGADLKDTFHGKMSDSQRQFIQDKVNALGLAFQTHVTANRPEIDDKYKHAGWYAGDEAISLGFVDIIGNLESAKSTLLELITLTN